MHPGVPCFVLVPGGLHGLRPFLRCFVVLCVVACLYLVACFVVSGFVCCVGVGLVLGFVVSCYVAWWRVLWRSVVARCFVVCYVVLFVVSGFVCCVGVGLVLGFVVPRFVAWWRVLWCSAVASCLVVCYVVMFCCCCFRWGLLGCHSAALLCDSLCGPFRCFPLLCGLLLVCFVGMLVACHCRVVWRRVSCRCVLS